MTDNTSPDQFAFAVGIECTMVVDERLDRQPPMRRLEEFELMKHYDMWKQDLDLVARLNAGGRRVKKVRWCFPWYRIEKERGKFDFSWTDKVVDYANELGIDLVPDLVHYGTPEWLDTAFVHPDYPKRVAAFGAACAERYKGRVSHYTPLNEPAITGIFSALRGEWPPYLHDIQGFIKVMLPVCRGIQESVKAMREIDPAAQMWAVEVINHYSPVNEQSRKAAKQAARKDLLYWDLVHGRVDDRHEFHDWLVKVGAPAKTLEELHSNPVNMDILGINFYPWSCKNVELKDGKVIESDTNDAANDGKLMLELFRTAHELTGAKMFVTETSAHGGGGARSSSVVKNMPDMRIAWMDQTMEAVRMARAEGLPVLGYTQFPLLTMVDWAYRIEPGTPEDYFINLGMIEVDPKTYERRWTPVADRFLHHVETFEQAVRI